MRRRLLIVPMDLDVEKDPSKMIENLPEKLEAELPGILNRLIEAYLRLKERGKFMQLKETQDKIDEMVRDSNPFEDWAADCLKATGDDSHLIFADDLFMNYQDYTDDIRLTKHMFCKHLAAYCKKNGVEYKKIRIQEQTKAGTRGLRILYDINKKTLLDF